MLDTQSLNQLIFDPFSGKMTWLEASRKYPLDDFIQAFRNTRAAMHRTIADLTDGQAAYHDPNTSIWSISETITHLVFSQGAYHNFLLDITDSTLPHVVEAARGFGEGARQGMPAQELRRILNAATERINDVLEQTRHSYDPTRKTRNPLFGEVNYEAWVLLLLAHEVDHVRQAIVMRRLAKAASAG